MNACKNDNDGIVLVIEGDNQVTVVDDTQKNKDSVVEINCDSLTTLPTVRTTLPTGSPTTTPKTLPTGGTSKFRCHILFSSSITKRICN